MYLVVGLGNPGTRYAGTRHNVGFLVADRLARRAGQTVDRKQFGALVADVSLRGHRTIVAKPQQFMNLSGQPVASILGYYKVPPTGLAVVHDDMDLPFGRLRLRVGGGHGGHNGVRDIQQHVKADFLRVKLGVGRPPPEWSDPADYVLSNWSPAEASDLDGVLDQAADAVEAFLADGAERAMNRFNAAPARVAPSQPQRTAAPRLEET
jgi:PTH1 family peptidyl-tRNA hydrolase